jgi:hypothetical protein
VGPADDAATGAIKAAAWTAGCLGEEARTRLFATTCEIWLEAAQVAPVT